MRGLIKSIVLLFIAGTLTSQNLIVDGSVGIWTSSVGKSLEVYGNILTKSSPVGGYATAFSAGDDGVTSFWMNNSYNPANHTSGWIRVMNLKDYNVGIGTVAPLYKLHVEDNQNDAFSIFGKSTSVSGGGIGVKGESNAESGRGVLGFAYGRLGRGVYGEASSGVGRGVEGVANGELGVGVEGSSSGTSGRGVLGIGIGQARGVMGWAGGTGSAVVGFAQEGYCDFDATGPGDNYCSTSSLRWKKNIENITSPLDKLSKLRGVTFTWDKEHGGHFDIGFIAEEIGRILPEIVVFEPNEVDARSMDYSKMTPLLVEAANAMRAEYQEKFDIQETRIVSLEQELMELKEMLQSQFINGNLSKH